MIALGIISDTHDHIQHTEQLLQQFAQKGVKHVLHMGDFCSPFMVPLFSQFRLDAIFGNNDGDRYTLMNRATLNGNALFHGEFAKFKFEGKLLAMYHGTHSELTEALGLCGEYDIVVSGHTHERRWECVNQRTWMLNPGTANGFGQKGSAVVLYPHSLKVDWLET